MRKLFRVAQMIKKSDMYSPFGEEPEAEKEEYVPDMPSPGEEMAKRTAPTPPSEEIGELSYDDEPIRVEFSANELNLITNGLKKLESHIYDVAEDTSKFKDVFENIKALRIKVNDLKSG